MCDKEILDILKKSPFILSKIYGNNLLVKQADYDKRYFWGTITNEEIDKVIKWLDKEPKEEEMKIFRSSKSGMMLEKDKKLSYLEFMIIYIESKIDKYEKITTMNMSQIISIYRALICDIKIDIRRLKENAK